MFVLELRIILKVQQRYNGIERSIVCVEVFPRTNVPDGAEPD